MNIDKKEIKIDKGPILLKRMNNEKRRLERFIEYSAKRMKHLGAADHEVKEYVDLIVTKVSLKNK